MDRPTTDKKHIQELEQAKALGQNYCVEVVAKVHSELVYLAAELKRRHKHDNDLHVRMSLLIEGAALCVQATNCAVTNEGWNDYFHHIRGLAEALPTINWTGSLPNNLKST